ncbi:hypothetical protein Taro_024336 [Colocasia esculenta]|uniref:Uncharacterized protein n=1 Tax=Colocasia esculenta TaxID=4460 RepID=A0A843V749_COLES|nr:hypothetical protein [Colocasia esculenta]
MFVLTWLLDVSRGDTWLFLPDHVEVWDAGAFVVRLWSPMVAPVFRELLCLGGCVPRVAFALCLTPLFLLLWLVRDWLSLLGLVREAHPLLSLARAAQPPPPPPPPPPPIGPLFPDRGKRRGGNGEPCQWLAFGHRRRSPPVVGEGAGPHRPLSGQERERETEKEQEQGEEEGGHCDTQGEGEVRPTLEREEGGVRTSVVGPAGGDEGRRRTLLDNGTIDRGGGRRGRRRKLLR